MNNVLLCIVPLCKLDSAIKTIMGSMNDVPAVPAPEGLRVEDIIETSPPEADGENMFQQWITMANNAMRGSDVRSIREALGLSRAKFTKYYRSTPSNIYTMERGNGRLQHRTRVKLMAAVKARIAEIQQLSAE